MTAAPAEAEAPAGRPRPGRIDPDTLDLISAQARQARPGHALLTLIGSVLYSIGWVLSKTFEALWLAGAWCFTAARMGWLQARGKPLAQPDIAEVMAENERLRIAIQRLGGG